MSKKRSRKLRRWKSTCAHLCDVELCFINEASGPQREIAMVHEYSDARVIALVPNMLDYIHARAAAGDRHARAIQARARYTPRSELP